ncbi:MAG: ferritin family protein [Armatimonadota bacterium]|nr:Rubrerythrin [bacterium]
MPDFANPFSQNIPPRKLTLGELIRAIRLDVSAEEEAASLYEAHAEATDNPVARKVLLDVANEERVHVGEFIELINILTAQEEAAWLANGAAEVRELAEEALAGDVELASPEEKAAEEGLELDGEGKPGGDREFTIGSLRE